MKRNPAAEQEHARKIEEAVEVLVAYGLEKHVSPTMASMGRETPFDPKRVVMPIPSLPMYRGLSIDLTATDVDKLLVAMFELAYTRGRDDGRLEAEQAQAAALLEALPALRSVVEEIADDVARKRCEDLRSDLS